MVIPNVNNLGGVFAGATVILLIMGLLSMILGIIMIISTMMIFKKSEKNMWFALIPVYNIIVMMDIIKMKYIELLYLLIPFVGAIIFSYKYSSNLAKAFGKSNAFALGLFFLGFIFIPLLAFSDDKYIYGTPNNEIINNVVFNPVGTSNTNNDNVLINNSKELVEAISSDSNLETNNNMIRPVNNNIEQPVNNNVSIVENIQTENINNEVTNVNESSMVEPLEIENTIIEEIPVESIPVETLSTEPVVIESLNIENKDNNIIPSIEVTPEVQENNNVVETNPLTEETLNTQDNPIIENVIPVLETNEIINVSENVNDNNEILELPAKNLCKNCGMEMPNIVTICPTCGHDNE